LSFSSEEIRNHHLIQLQNREIRNKQINIHPSKHTLKTLKRLHAQFMKYPKGPSLRNINVFGINQVEYIRIMVPSKDCQLRTFKKNSTLIP